MADAPKLLGTDTLRQAYPKFNQAIDNANEALTKATTAESNSSTAVSTANAAETKADSVQEQFNQVVIEGDSSVEAAQARVDAGGNTFTTLKERLDSSDAQLADNAIYVENFKGTDTQKIQAALNAVSASNSRAIRFRDNKTYLLDSQILGVSDIWLLGNNTTIKCTTRIADAMFKFTGKKNIVVVGLTFDSNVQSLPVYQQSEYPKVFSVPLFFDTCSGYIKIFNCNFINLYNKSINVYQSSGTIIIENNNFSSPVQTQTQILDHISIVTFTGKINIQKNNFDNAPPTSSDYGICGIVISGQNGSVNIDKNDFNYCGRNNTGSHRLNVIDLYGDTENVTITDNNAFNCTWAFCRLNGSKNAKVKNNRVFANVTPDTGMIYVSCLNNYETENVEIEHNYIESSVDLVYGIVASITDWGKMFNGLKIRFNKFKNIRNPVKYAGAGKNISIVSNEVVEGTITTAIAIDFTTVVAATETIGTQVNSTLENIEISGNTLISNSTAINVNATGYTGKNTDVIKILNNNITTTGIAVATNTVTVLLTENKIFNSSIGLYLRNMATSYAFNNLMFNVTTGINAGTITALYKSNNYNNGTIVA